MNPINPLLNSNVLAEWTAKVLSDRGIDEVLNWRMLEYWLQVELYRAVENGTAGAWRHIGEYEQPYFTNRPRSGSRTKTKWVDLVLAEPSLTEPSSIVWIELKDMGRNADTIKANAKGLGQDLAALWSLRPQETQQMWIDPPAHVIDRGRLQEWKTYASGLTKAQHFISQIVIVPNPIDCISANKMEEEWLAAFHKRIESVRAKIEVIIGRAETMSFTVHALIHGLPEGNGK